MRLKRIEIVFLRQVWLPGPRVHGDHCCRRRRVLLSCPGVKTKPSDRLHVPTLFRDFKPYSAAHVIDGIDMVDDRLCLLSLILFCFSFLFHYCSSVCFPTLKWKEILVQERLKTEQFRNFFLGGGLPVNTDLIKWFSKMITFSWAWIPLELYENWLYWHKEDWNKQWM